MIQASNRSLGFDNEKHERHESENRHRHDRGYVRQIVCIYWRKKVQARPNIPA